MNERSILNELDTDNSSTKVRSVKAKSSADVAWEQVLDASWQANIQRAATKVTSADDFTFTLRLFVSVLPTESNQSVLEFKILHLSYHIHYCSIS